MLESIFEALRRNAPDIAIERARAALTELPSNPDLHHLLGLALSQKGQLAAALESLDHALVLAPDSARFHVTRAQISLASGDVNAARSDLSAAAQQNPNALPAYLGLARIELAAGKLDAAEAQLRLAARVNPDDTGVLMMQGQLALARGQADAALGALNRVAEQLPNNPAVQTNLGLAYLQRGWSAVAEQAFRNALALDPGMMPTRRLLIGVLVDSGNRDEARSQLEALLKQVPRDAGAWGLLGQIEASLGNLTQATQAFLRSLEQAPEQPALLERLMALWGANTQDGSEARTALEALLALHPQSHMLWNNRFALDALTPDGDAVLARWREAVPDSPDADEAAAQRAEALGDAAGAEALADRVLERLPERVGANLVKARCEFARDREAGIARLAGLSQRTLPPALLRSVLGLRGMWLDAVDRPAEALQCWLDALRSNEASAGMTLPGFVPAGPAVNDPDCGASARFLWSFPATPATAVITSLSPLAPVLVDRFGDRARVDGLGPLRPKAGHHGEEGAEWIWREDVQKLGLDPDRVIDVLPHCDPAILSALPGARLLALVSDPRDLLLRWLAVGSSQGFVTAEPDSLARWLAVAMTVLSDRLATAPSRTALLKAEDLDQDAAAALRTAGQFFGFDGEPAEYRFGQDQLTAASITSGRWRAYAGPLASAFATLQPAAVALGYPAE